MRYLISGKVHGSPFVNRLYEINLILHQNYYIVAFWDIIIIFIKDPIHVEENFNYTSLHSICSEHIGIHAFVMKSSDV